MPPASPGLEAPTLRTAALRPELRWLLLSSMGSHHGLRGLWLHFSHSSWPKRLGQTVAGTVVGWPGIRRVVRRVIWHRIHPGFEELAFGSACCVGRDPRAPGRVFKADLRSCFYPPERQIEFLRRVTADYDGLRAHFGDYLEETRFEQRDVGARRPCWVVGASQRWVIGAAFQPGRTVTGDLRRQWREICATAMRTARETGLWLDVTGCGNVLIERPPRAPARLVIVDTLPMLALESATLPDDRARIERARRLVLEGLRA